MENSQTRAVRNYRARLGALGVSRFEVLAKDADRNLIRTVARRLAQDGPAAENLRATVSAALADAPGKKGGILAALRRSPLVGADLDLKRPRIAGRKIRI